MGDLYVFDRNQVERLTLHNLIEAGIIKPDEAQQALLAMRDLDPKDLLAVMLESHQLREDASKAQYFPIDYLSISKN